LQVVWFKTCRMRSLNTDRRFQFCVDVFENLKVSHEKILEIRQPSFFKEYFGRPQMSL